MPRTGGGTGPFVLNPVYLAVPGTTILATQHNTPLEDIEDTFNIPQPIAYGGTQASSAIGAMDNLFIVGDDIASSASLDLDNVTGSFVNITGTTAVTSIALSEDAIRFARAVSALPLTASANLIVNGSTTQSYTCEPGDELMIVGYSGAVVRIWVQGLNSNVALRNVNNNFTATQSIVSTDAGSAPGPLLTLFRDSASPAINDAIGGENFTGRASDASAVVYAQTYAGIVDPTAGSIDGSWAVAVSINNAITNSLVVSPNVIARGTATNDSASAGFIGEYTASVVPAGLAVNLTSNVVANMTSISLTPGDWDVNAAFVFTGGATTTVAYWAASISTTSATLTQTNGQSVSLYNANTAPYNNVVNGLVCMHVSPVRLSLNATTTVYATVQTSFATSTSNVHGVLRARRVR